MKGLIFMKIVVTLSLKPDYKRDYKCDYGKYQNVYCNKKITLFRRK